MAPPQLLDLPVEILQAICQQLCAHCTSGSDFTPPKRLETGSPSLPDVSRPKNDTKALIALSQTCRKLYPIARPVVYHEYVSEQWKTSHVAGFFRTILERPDLAALVQRLSLASKDFEEPSSLSIQGQLIRDNLVLPPGFDGKLYMANIDESREDCTIHNTWSELCVDLILSTLPNMTQLHLSILSYSPYGALLPQSPTLLSALKAIQLETKGINGFHLETCAGLLTKPANLERLQLTLCTSIGRRLDLGTVRWLKLVDCMLFREHVHTLAESCPNLETFISHNRNATLDDVDHCTPRAFAEGVLPCKDTLRHLEIHFVDRSAGQVVPNYSIVSLKEFGSLKTLILTGDCVGLLDASMILHGTPGDQSEVAVSFVDLLPPSIETLIIEGNYTGLYNPLLALASEVRNQKFPFLKTVKETRFDWKFPSHAVKPVKDAMEASGVSFEISEESAFCLQ
ncbi:hypothetical protein BGZ61DRAFT_454490 [Ilyonectria robusta]|uniref:uncharacterized protein n=1 Tax=Ilyonectria robusta TaxID=1079257 RepID=UPI001E8DFEFB|nr:uncharacterized protein BGZ61DRAFT_454490 [Ilyonectria robusta]KAH8686451.1 hypothetical protein BGZ61DRAFT_454490 [Ilyonectria robusta]